MTGHLGAKLQVGLRRVVIDRAEIGGVWTWSIRYYKFRGRGGRATEKYLGADGIFVLETSFGARTEAKSLLFQAKMEGAGGRKLVEQSIKLSTWREAAFIAEYTRKGFNALSLDRTIREEGRPSSVAKKVSLSDYLGNEFLECTVGDDELRYDARGRVLRWRAHTGEMVATEFTIGHRFTVRVDHSTLQTRLPGIDRIVNPEEIHDYRMKATPSEILGVHEGISVRELSEAKKRLALAYHPDHHSMLDDFLQSILQRRMQEVTEAYATLDRHSKQNKK